MASKRPTLKTISELSGFAVTTVSRALNDGPEIGQATKDKVRQIAKEIGYVRNRAGLGLVTGKTNVISFILSSDHDVIDEHTGRLIAAIASTLQSTMYHMNIVTYASSQNRLEEVKHVVETQSADAIILSQIKPEDRRVKFLMEHNFPFVTYGQTLWKDKHRYFDFDNAVFGAEAARGLVSKGRKRLLLIAPPMDLTYGLGIVDGIQRALADCDTDFECLEGATSHDGNEAMLAALNTRLSAGPVIDGIIAPSTAAAVVSLGALEHNGRKLGQDIDLFAKEATPYLQYVRKEVISVYEDLSLAGAFLAKAAIQAIDRPDEPLMQRLELRHPLSGYP